MNNFRAVLALATVSLAAHSAALSFSVTFKEPLGSYSMKLTASGFVGFSESVFAQVNDAAPFSRVDVFLNNSTAQWITLSDGGTNSLTIEPDGRVDNDGFTAEGVWYDASHYNGGWRYVSGTGDYAGFSTEQELYGTVHMTHFEGGTTFEVGGTLEAVPEPASIAALGAGALLIVRRRRKA